MDKKLHQANLLFSLVVVFSLVGGTYYFLINKKVSPLPEVFQEGEVTPTPFVYAGWREKTFADFSFKYPSDWEERKSPRAGVFLIGPEGERGISLGVQEGVSARPGESVDELALQALGRKAPASRKETGISGHRVIIQERESGQGMRLEAYVENVDSRVKSAKTGEEEVLTGTKLIYLEAQEAGKADLCRQIFERILATFKFNLGR